MVTKKGRKDGELRTAIVRMIINEKEWNTLAESTEKILGEGLNHARVQARELKTVGQDGVYHEIVKMVVHQDVRNTDKKRASTLVTGGVVIIPDQEDGQIRVD